MRVKHFIVVLALVAAGVPNAQESGVLTLEQISKECGLVADMQKAALFYRQDNNQNVSDNDVKEFVKNFAKSSAKNGGYKLNKSGLDTSASLVALFGSALPAEAISERSSEIIQRTGKACLKSYLDMMANNIPPLNPLIDFRRGETK
jgi:hypothetical protein